VPRPPAAPVQRFFIPDGARARAMDAAMHRDFKLSLSYLASECRGKLNFDALAADRLIARLDRGARMPPAAFAHYYALAFSLLDERTSDAEGSWRDLLGTPLAKPGLRVTALEDPATSTLGALYTRLMRGEDGASDAMMRSPPAEVARNFERRFGEALELVGRAFPELAEEFTAIIREVVCVVGDPARTMQFDGGSHFQLWGALFINADFHPTPAAMMEVIAHESAHSVLFGFCTHEPLVRGDDEPRYASPLRGDPRPMDGIYHATFVSARMHLAMSRLLASGALDPSAHAGLVAAIEANERNFRSGDEIVRAHADLTPLGRELIEGARSYMSASAERSEMPQIQDANAS